MKMMKFQRNVHGVATAATVLLLVFFVTGLLAASPNILLIVSEDNGPEIGCYGDPYARTPTLDALAADGVRFENAFVPYSVCSPSRACFLTGLHSHQNGQIGLATHKFAMYREDTPNIVTLLKPAGYLTGLIGKLHVNPESAFPFDYRAIASANFQRKSPVTEYAAKAAEFFERAGREGKPWFLSVNYPDAHLPFIKKVNGRPAKPLSADEVKPMPWVGADTPRIREQVANYYNCMERLDDGVELLLDELERAGAAEDTLVIYIGDHGAQFPRGKGTVHEAGLRVPMIVRWPGVTKAGGVREELVSTLDILPTALAAAGVAPDLEEELSGLDLRRLLEGGNVENWRRYSFALTTGSFPRNCYVQHSVRDARFKLISNPHPGTNNLISGSYLDPKHPHFVVSGATLEDQAMASESVIAAWELWKSPPHYQLYDLENDPHEWRSLAEDPGHAETLARMIGALENWQKRTRDPFSDPVNVEAFVAEQLANRDFGYRTNKDFRWSYVEDFAKWRAARIK
jgi:N-sulfoglucosamine sulfohydrolase